MKEQTLLKDEIQQTISENLSETELYFRLLDSISAYELGQAVPQIKVSHIANWLQQRHSQAKSEVGISTGYHSLDALLCGVRSGELVVVGGRPAMGKTQFLVHWALHISKELPVLFFSCDLDAQKLYQRLLATVAQDVGICQENMASPWLENFKQDLMGRKIYLAETMLWSLTVFKNELKKQVESSGIRVVYIDYLQGLYTHRYKNNRAMELSLICRELKKIAQELGLLIIVSSQLGRSAEQHFGAKRPLLSDLSDSGAIEQIADKVLFLYRPAYYGITENEDGYNIENELEIIVAKNNAGKTGSSMLYLKDETAFLIEENPEKSADKIKDKWDAFNQTLDDMDTNIQFNPF